MSKLTKKYGKAGQYMQLLLKIGLVMIISILLCFAAGFYLIKKFNLNESIIIVFVFVGVGIGFYKIYQEIKTLN